MNERLLEAYEIHGRPHRISIPVSTIADVKFHRQLRVSWLDLILKYIMVSIPIRSAHPSNFL